MRAEAVFEVTGRQANRVMQLMMRAIAVAIELLITRPLNVRVRNAFGFRKPEQYESVART